jgi:hypothetical protein
MGLDGSGFWYQGSWDVCWAWRGRFSFEVSVEVRLIV